MKRVLLVLLTLLVLGLAAWGAYRGALSYSGYCFEKGRYLTEREIINAAVMNAMSYQKAFREEQRTKGSVSYQTDLRDWANRFTRDHPGCCRIGPEDGFPNPAFAQRLFGAIQTIVVVEGPGFDPWRDKWQLRVGNCGDVWSD
jgi:hypothetical protein